MCVCVCVCVCVRTHGRVTMVLLIHKLGETLRGKHTFKIIFLYKLEEASSIPVFIVDCFPNFLNSILIYLTIWLGGSHFRNQGWNLHCLQ